MLVVSFGSSFHSIGPAIVSSIKAILDITAIVDRRDEANLLG